MEKNDAPRRRRNRTRPDPSTANVEVAAEHYIHRIVTDNGACYRATDFATVLRSARHQRITLYTPRHNGKVERYHRILAEEFLYARTWTSEHQRTAALHVWNVHYNYHRPHTAAGKPATSHPAPHRRHQRQ